MKRTAEQKRELSLTRLAVILQEGSLTPRERRLGRILDFFGVPWKTVAVPEFPGVNTGSVQCTAFGPLRAVATAVEQAQRTAPCVSRLAAFYAYADDDLRANESGIRSLCGDANLSFHEAPAGNHSLRISRQLDDLTGPMSGLEVSLQLGNENAVLVDTLPDLESGFATIMSAAGVPVFVRIHRNDVPIFFCTSSQMVDIDELVTERFYDVKEHFCSVVPLVMFLRFMFPDLAWHPQELGACLIIDDPLLRSRYGFCNFAHLRDLMQRHGFTMNIAFIPWNWRRTSPAAADFFRDQSRLFSVSIHGCDHVAGEFGAASTAVLDSRTRLAQSRMRNHEARTGIKHDPIMVFPQGIFSSGCPEILKRNGLLAAVNTETVPVDSHNSRTRIRDVWDVAITSYGGFPIFTRRYASDGLENFAFDLLLGKPCLIVAHHDFFQDGGAELIALIEKLQSLNSSVRWRPLGEVARRACRRRANGVCAEEVEMYGAELLLDNPSDQTIEVRIRKRESQANLISEILCDEKPVIWAADFDYLMFGERILPHSERRFQVIYREQADATVIRRSLRYEMCVAARRMLSEFRDDYLSKSRFLSATATRLKSAFTRAN